MQTFGPKVQFLFRFGREIDFISKQVDVNYMPKRCSYYYILIKWEEKLHFVKIRQINAEFKQVTFKIFLYLCSGYLL